MKEISFIRRNIEKWKAYQAIVDDATTTAPDMLADVYTDLTADLAFSQTNFPQSRITIYLNNMASALHRAIYRNKRERWSRLITFWTQEIPHTIYSARKELYISLLIFIISALLGSICTLGEPDTVRYVLGDGYVDMTLNNIDKGKPMDVYGSMGEELSFFAITINNIGVAFRCFAMGLFTSIASGLMLFFNGFMLGAFQTFFYQHHVLYQSILAIWLHGTLEITAIIVAGAGGIALGNSMIFPGTYPRLYSFMRGAKRGMKIAIGTVPVFCVAGFIESFITRHTEWPNALRLAIILTLLLWVIYYYVYLPYKIK